jgi:hypothetical protein
MAIEFYKDKNVLIVDVLKYFINQWLHLLISWHSFMIKPYIHNLVYFRTPLGITTKEDASPQSEHSSVG